MGKERLRARAENQYSAKVKEISDRHTDEYGIIRFDASDLEIAPAPADGDWWGPWRYDAGRLVLEFYDERGEYIYEVDLERCDTGAAALDWIFQLNDKIWCGHECVGQLVEAIHDLLEPIRGLGVGKSLDVSAHLRAPLSESGHNEG